MVSRLASTQQIRIDQVDDDEFDSLSVTTLLSGSNIRPTSRPTSCVYTRVTVAGISIWMLFAVIINPPFAAYWMLVNAVVLVSAYANCTDRSITDQELIDKKYSRGTIQSKHGVCALAVLTFCANLFALIVLREFEIKDLAHYDAPSIPLDAESDVQFFQLYNPRLGYMDDIEAIHRYVNNQTSMTQRYTVDMQLNAWSADVLRYNFLLQFWHQLDQQQSQQFSNRTKIACLVESDVVFHEVHFADALRAHQPLELAHVQHFWGHRTLEPFNIGILCTSSDASWLTRNWAWIMQALHAKRYRRLLYLDFLYALVPDRLIFYWDEHHGCTEYYPHCQYVHFTRPKAVGIDNAMQTINKLENNNLNV